MSFGKCLFIWVSALYTQHRDIAEGQLLEPILQSGIQLVSPLQASWMENINDFDDLHRGNVIGMYAYLMPRDPLYSV